MSDTDSEDSKSFQFLSQFLAKYDPDETERDAIDIYNKLMKNDPQALQASHSAAPNASQKYKDPWPWRRRYDAKGWLDFYRQNRDDINAKAVVYQRRWAEAMEDETRKPLKPLSASRKPSSYKTPKSVAGPSKHNSSQRVLFDDRDDANLVRWLAIENPVRKGRQSISTYERLTDNTNLWPWARRHTSESWKERYKKNWARFERAIEQYQKKHDIEPSEPRERKDKQPRLDIWANVPGFPSIENIPQSQANVSSQTKKKQTHALLTSKQGRKPTTSQRRADLASVRRVTNAKPSETADEGEVPRLSQKAKGKMRVVPQDEESEEEEGRAVVDDVLPVLQEEPEIEDQGDQGMEGPPPQDEDDGVPMQEDDPEHEVQEDEEPPFPGEALEHSGVQEDGRPRGPSALPDSETQDVLETEDLLHESQPPQWVVLPNDESEPQSEEEDEIDELESDTGRPIAPPPRAKNQPKKTIPTVPRKHTQGPTPPTSDTSPVLSHKKPSQEQQQQSTSRAPIPPSSPAQTERTTTVLRKRTHAEIFEDVGEEAATSTPRPTKRRALPVREEGAFFNTVLGDARRPGGMFKNGKRATGVDEMPSHVHEESSGVVVPPVPWPPTRGSRAAAKQPVKPSEPVLEPPPSQYQPFATPSPVKDGRDTEGSPSKTQIPTPPKKRVGPPSQYQPFATPSQVKDGNDVEVSPSKPQIPTPAKKRVGPIAPAGTESEARNAPPSRSPQKSPFKRGMPPPPPPTVNKASVVTPSQSHISKGKGRADIPPMPEAGPSTMRRHTFADAPGLYSSPSFVPGIRPRHSLPVLLPSPSRPSGSRRSSPQVTVDGVALSEEDQRAVMEAGLDFVLRRKAASSGFQLDVVRKGFQAVRRLSLLDEWLKRMSDTVANTARDVTAQLVEEAERSGYYESEEVDGVHSSWDQTTFWSDGMSKQSEMYHPPEDSRAADFLRAAAERSRMSDEQGSSSNSFRQSEANVKASSIATVRAPSPQRNIDPRVSKARKTLERLRSRKE